MIARAVLIAAALAAVASTAGAQRSGDPLRGFDGYVTQAMRAWDVPGLAIAIVRNDSVVLARGFGTRTLGRNEPVDARTMFAIASVSKAFTATLTAMLVGEKQLRWDDRATTHIPGFELYDPYVTRELTIRDLLSHRSGLPRGDLIWYATEHSTEQVLQRVRFLRPSWSLRSRYGYQNIMYVAASQVAANISKMKWERAISARIFEPLGMSETNVSVRDLEGKPNVATPHAKIDDTVRAIRYRNVDNIIGAGAINSNVADMAKWVRFQLSHGRKPDGTRIVDSAALAETYVPHTVIRIDSASRLVNPYTHLSTYALGWQIQDYRGRELRRHGGNLDGMTSHIAIVPEERLGIIILTNMGGSGLPSALMYRVIDAYMGVSPRDWSTILVQSRDRAIKQGRQREAKRDSARVTGTSPSLAPDRYVGTYVDSMYGEVKIERGDDRRPLVARFGPAYVGDMEHWHFDTYRVHWRDRTLGKSWISFTLNSEGKVSKLTIEDVGEFGRAPDKPAATANASP